VVALGVGTIVTIVSAIFPSMRASRVPPLAAIREITVGAGAHPSRRRLTQGGALSLLGIVAFVAGLTGSGILWVGIGALLMFVGAFVLGPLVARPFARALGAPVARVSGVTGVLARENAMRNPKRTAATASALMIGVGLVGFITIFAASTKVSFGNTIDNTFSGDFIVTSGQFGAGGLDPAFTARLNELPEVETAAGIRAGMAEIDGGVQSLLGTYPATFELFDVKPIAGSPDDLDANSIAVFEDVAKEKDLEVGDRLLTEFAATGRQDLIVRFIYGENQPAGDYLLGIEAFEANFPDQLDFQVFVKQADAVSGTDALRAVEREANRYPGAKVLDQTEYKAEQTQFVDQILGLVYALLFLAIIIALLGIGNTLALSIFERTRELGVMRAVGMTRAQLRSTIRWEAVIIALQGTLLGLVVGVFFGWALVTALKDEGLNTFTVPWVSLAIVVVLAALAGVIAAVLPARRAAKLDVLRAVVTE
jgi:putative ABC transport system permease protein